MNLNPNISGEQIDKLINFKLNKLENEMALCKKYDLPENQKFDQPSNLKAQISEPEEDNQKQNKEEDSNEGDDDDFGEWQYEKLQDDQEPLQQMNFDEIEHKDPFSQPLDTDLIKKFMSEINLPLPPWAQNQDAWKNKLQTVLKSQIDELNYQE